MGLDGKEIHERIMKKDSEPPEWDELSKEEQKRILKELKKPSPSDKPESKTASGGMIVMRIFLYVMVVLAFIVGGAIFASPKSSTQELDAFIVLLIAAVLFGAGAIVEAICQLRKDINSRIKG